MKKPINNGKLILVEKPKPAKKAEVSKPVEARKPTISDAIRPSKIELLEYCPGSIKLVPVSDIESSSKAAAEGTQAHRMLELLLNGYKIKTHPRVHTIQANYYRVDVSKGWLSVIEVSEVAGREVLTVPSGNLKKVIGCYDLVQSILANSKEIGDPAVLNTEVELVISPLAKTGSADIVILMPKDRSALIIDYKNGAGIMTDARMQGMCYAIGALEAYDIDKVIFGVYQEKDNEEAPLVLHKPYFKDKLNEYISYVTKCIEDGLKEDAPLIVGRHCHDKFCPSISVCPKHIEVAKKAIGMNFDENTRMSDDHYEVAKNFKNIENYLVLLKAKLRVLVTAEDPRATEIAKVSVVKGKIGWDNTKNVIEMAKKAGLKHLVKESMIAVSSVDDKDSAAAAFLAKATKRGAEGSMMTFINSRKKPKSKTKDIKTKDELEEEALLDSMNDEADKKRSTKKPL